MSRIELGNLVEFVEAFYKAKTSENAKKEWELIFRIFNIYISKGEMYVPEVFYPKVQKWFGEIDDKMADTAVSKVENQLIVRINNNYTFSQTLFNFLRKKRPMNNDLPHKSLTEVADEIEEIPEKCDFCSPLNYTGIDLWGRIERDTCLTASNCAKYDGQHSLIIFKEHSPIKYSKEKLNDIFSICEEWFSCANEASPRAVFPMLSWNCKYTAGASQNHGHSHLLLGENMHYGKWEYLKNCGVQYNLSNPGCNYFEDLIEASKTLGLVKTFGKAHIIVNLTPSFGIDLMIIAWNFDRDFRDAMDSAIKTIISRFKSYTFNIGIHFPPLEEGQLRKRLDSVYLKNSLKESDAPMPFIAYLVDRGEQNYGKYISDLCGVMLNGSNIVSSDPFEIAKIVRVTDILWQ